MDKLISIDAVLNYISRAARKESSDLQIKSDALQCYKSLQSGLCTIEDFSVLPIVNNRVNLPKDTTCINKVQWMCYDPTAEDEVDLLCKSDASCNSCHTKIECCKPGIYFGDEDAYCGSCDGCITEPESFISRSNNICRHTLSYKLWLDSGFYRNNFKTLKYSGVKSKFINDKCRRPSNCIETWSYDSEANSILVDIPNGYLYIEYQRLPRDSGSILIPNNTDLLQGLAWWCEYKIADDRAWMHEQGMAQMSTLKLQQAESRLKRYRGNKILKGIDLQLHDAIGGTSSDSQLLLRSNLL